MMKSTDSWVNKNILLYWEKARFMIQKTPINKISPNVHTMKIEDNPDLLFKSCQFLLFVERIRVQSKIPARCFAGEILGLGLFEKLLILKLIIALCYKCQLYNIWTRFLTWFCLWNIGKHPLVYSQCQKNHFVICTEISKYYV